MKDTRPLLWQRIRENAGKVDWEIPRKALHSSIGFFTIYLYTSHGTPRLVVLALSTALAIIVPADILRLRYPSFARVYEKCLGFLMRESEKKTSNGVIWYILGVNFVLSVYPLDVATVSILILSWADTAASTVGRLLGPYSPRLPRRVPLLGLPFAERKSLAGFLAASITGACIAMGFWLWIGPVRPADLTWTWETGVASALNQPGWGSRLLSSLGIGSVNFGGWMGLGLIGLIAGLVSGVAEALDLGSLDDNLTLPIISGGFLLGLFRLAGFFSS
jgi:diacylglycerol kinase (CTP)